MVESFIELWGEKPCLCIVAAQRLYRWNIRWLHWHILVEPGNWGAAIRLRISIALLSESLIELHLLVAIQRSQTMHKLLFMEFLPLLVGGIEHTCQTSSSLSIVELLLLLKSILFLLDIVSQHSVVDLCNVRVGLGGVVEVTFYFLS